MTFLEQLCQALNQQQVDYAIVGGHAVALLGTVRGKADIDLVINFDLSGSEVTTIQVAVLQPRCWQKMR